MQSANRRIRWARHVDLFGRSPCVVARAGAAALCVTKLSGGPGWVAYVRGVCVGWAPLLSAAKTLAESAAHAR